MIIDAIKAPVNVETAVFKAHPGNLEVLTKALPNDVPVLPLDMWIKIKISVITATSLAILNWLLQINWFR